MTTNTDIIINHSSFAHALPLLVAAMQLKAAQLPSAVGVVLAGVL